MSIPGQMTLEVFANQDTNTQTSGFVTDTQGASALVHQERYILEAAEVILAQSAEMLQQISVESTQTVQPNATSAGDVPSSTNAIPKTVTRDNQQEKVEDLFNREAVMKFINDAGLLSYNVRALRINDYLKSLYRMAHLLSMSKLRREAIREV